MYADFSFKIEGEMTRRQRFYQDTMNEVSAINQKFTQIYETSELALQKQNKIW